MTYSAFATYFIFTARAIVRTPYDDVLKNMFRSRSLFLIFVLGRNIARKIFIIPNCIGIIIIFYFHNHQCIIIIIIVADYWLRRVVLVTRTY